MRVFFDQNVPRNLRELLRQHEVVTAAERGWSELENGDLLKAVEEAGFEVFVTGDSNLVYQQNLSGRVIAIVALTRNNWPLVRQHVEEVAEAISAATPGSYKTLDTSGR